MATWYDSHRESSTKEERGPYWSQRRAHPAAQDKDKTGQGSERKKSLIAQTNKSEVIARDLHMVIKESKWIS